MGDVATERDECVLIVDDEEGAREVMRELVEMAGCSAIVAANGAEAMQVLTSVRPCLVVLDLLMPVMTGEEVLSAMRRQPSLASIPVLVSTSAPSRAPSGVPVMAKPIDIQAFWNWMRGYCRCAAHAPVDVP
jgi:CheY-like chemotaxis protein